MSSVDEIKAAAEKLPPNEKVNLYRWLDESAEIRRWRLESLKREIAIGLEQLDRGEAEPLDIEAIKREGRERLAARDSHA